MTTDPSCGTEESPSGASRDVVSGTSDESLFNIAMDSELTAPEDEAPSPATRPSSFRKWINGYLLVAALACAPLVYWVFVRDDAVLLTQMKPAVPGWDDLIPCSLVTSFEGTKQLTLFENHRVKLLEEARSKDGHPQNQDEGLWSFDGDSKRYSLTLNGVTMVYTLVSPEQTDTCILISGDLEAANLRRSWFSTTNSATESDDQESRDRE
jgi:hypothetical protein